MQLTMSSVWSPLNGSRVAARSWNHIGYHQQQRSLRDYTTAEHQTKCHNTGEYFDNHVKHQQPR